MTWTRPKYFHILSSHRMEEGDLNKTQQPWVEVPTLSSLNPWLEKLEKDGRSYCIAKYAAMAPSSKIVMRVFGIFLKEGSRQ